MYVTGMIDTKIDAMTAAQTASWVVSEKCRLRIARVTIATTGGRKISEMALAIRSGRVQGTATIAFPGTLGSAAAT
jgi:hypothetical protein